MSEHIVRRKVTIIYRRLPNDLGRFSGILRKATASKLIIESPIKVRRPVRFSGKIVADTGYLAIWFVYKARWYDIGKFYDRYRKWIGYYCDIIIPAKKLLATARTTCVFTDLFLDLWITKHGRAYVLDEDELEKALKRHEISRSLATQAGKQIRVLLGLVKAGRFPPLEVQRIEPLGRIG